MLLEHFERKAFILAKRLFLEHASLCDTKNQLSTNNATCQKTALISLWTMRA